MELSLDYQFIIFQLCFDLNTYFKKLIVEYLLETFQNKRFE